MKLHMPRFDQSRVLVVGDLMLDRYWHGNTSRVSPEAPVPVVDVKQIEDRPGGAGNVALNIAALGGASVLSGIVGRDEAGGVLQQRLEAANILCQLQVSPTHPTITKLRVISRHQQLLRLDFEDPFMPDDAEALSKTALAAMKDAKALVISDYAKGALQDPQPLIQAARSQGIAILVDPKGTDFRKYRGATLLTPNLHEFEAIVGKTTSEQDLVEKAQSMIHELELQALLVTRGEYGMSLIRPGEPEFHLPARAREVFDVTGAGDTVISVLAAALGAGDDLPNAVALANLAAGIVVGKLGTAAISAPELRRAVQREQGSERGAVTVDQLQLALEDARAHGERIVFTNGCFDIIHAGHVGYLEQARKLGDRLVVAVNSDQSVTKLKGPGRPINPQDRRMAVLAGLEAVDWVVCFNDDTPEPMLEVLKPEVLVKGGDYDKEGVVGWQIVESYGGEVKVLSFFDDCSTTAIVEKVLEKNRPK